MARPAPIRTPRPAPSRIKRNARITRRNSAQLQKKSPWIYDVPRCQCISSCAKPPLEGEAFCEKHMKGCPREAPLSGYEPPYEPTRWNDRKEIRLTHNCFSYAMNTIDDKQITDCMNDANCNTPFHQPGSISGYPRFNDTDPKTCPNMIGRIMGDNNTITPSAFELKCPAGSSKIALIVDEDQDYHFLRQDKNGYFSQKSGALPVTNLDAPGHKIFDAQLANHNFHKYKDSHLNYDRFCGYFCVPRNRRLHLKVGGRRTRRRARQ